METKDRKKIAFGIFTTIAVILFFAGIFFIGKKENLFSKTFTLSAVFTDINGLRKGNYVHYAGLRAGVIQKINFINDSILIVDMKMDQQIQNLIKKDAKVYISTEGLVGEKIIDIKPVFKSREAVKDNDTLIAIDPYDTHEIIQKLLATNNNASIISNNLAKLSDQVNKPHKGLLTTLTNDTSAVKSFTEILHSLNITGKQMANLSAHLENLVDHIDLNKGTLGLILSDAALKEDITSTFKNLNETSELSLKVIEKLNNSIQDPANNSALSVLAKDSVFAKNLKESVENLKNSSRKLDENMEALQHSKLLKSYFKNEKK